jgi:lysozyme
MAKKKSKLPACRTGRPKWVKITLWFLLIIAIVIVAYENKKYLRHVYRYLTYHYNKTSSNPSNFPEGFEVHGIDISHFQEIVQWNKLQALNTKGDTIHFQFVYIKATQGILIEDNMFDENWEEAKDHHIVRGAYHYFLPDRDPQVQALNFINNVKLKTGDLPPAIDIENDKGKSKQEIVSALKEFIVQIEAHYKVKPIIYSNINFIEDYLADDFRDYGFWVSHYNQTSLEIDDDSLKCFFWQHSNKSDLLGINGNTDVDVFNGTKQAFDSLLVK